MESREGITIEVNLLEDDKEYQVYATRIEEAVQATRKRKSDRLNPESSPTATDMNTTTQLKVTFAATNNDIVEVHAILDDDV